MSPTYLPLSYRVADLQAEPADAIAAYDPDSPWVEAYRAELRDAIHNS
jgi:hypothetical protein